VKDQRKLPAAAGKRPGSQAGPTALLILGMHRSGTSALAGAAARLGADLGTRLIDAAPDNPAGYWEHADAVAIHERLLHELDSSWEDVRDLPRGWATSAAAGQAMDAIASLIRDEFVGQPLWAVKDPRLCRFVPLWLTVLHDLSIRPAFMVIARNPDEVARSLGARDRLGGDHARLLWLRSMVDVEADTRGHARELLSYDALLSNPVAVLDDAARRLDFDWPLESRSRDEAVAGFLATDHRHHRLPLDASGAGAKENTPAALFKVCRDSPQADAWKAIAAARPALETAVEQIEPWIGGLMTALSRARTQLQETQRRFAETDAALGELQQLSLRRLDEIGGLGARLAESEVALEAAQALSIQRLGMVEALDKALGQAESLAQARATQLAEAHAALELERVRSLERLQQLGEFDRRLADTDAALKNAQALSLQRLAENRELDAELGKTQAALAAAESLSLQRLAENRQLDAELGKTQAALAAAESLSLQRLAENRQMDAELGTTQAALAAAESLSLQRLAENRQLDVELGTAQAALGAVEALSLERLDEISGLEKRLQLMDAARADAIRLSVERAAEIERHVALAAVQSQESAARQAELMARLEAESRTLAAANALAAERLAETEAQVHRALAAEAELGRVYASPSWRISAPLRWIASRIAVKSRNDPG
jgi:hypothetical protein